MRRALVLCCAAALLASGCTSSGTGEPDVPAPDETLSEFVDAWNERDGAAMNELMVAPVRRLDRFFGSALGDEVDFEVEAESVVTKTVSSGDESPAGTLADVEYAISYSVAGAVRERSFEGTFEMELDGDRWAVSWDTQAMWPEHPGASGLRIARKWPRRAPILDRRGETLAAGPAPARRYPFGAAAGSTVGHVGALTKREAAGTGYEPGELAGASGMELAFDERLAGTPGLRVEIVDGKQRAGMLLRSQPLPGKPVKTTLDMRVQQSAAAAFGGTTGGAVVLDPKTGDVLAVVSSAELNPANYVGARDVNPFNRALSGLYPPGSSLKVMTGAAALETGVVDLGTKLTGPAEYKGVRNFESGEFGTLDFATAVKFSVNTAFAQIAEDLGARRITRYAKAFGFNRPPEMALGAATSSFPRPEDDGDLMWGSIGQAQVLATPLQMSTVAATIANGGRRMEPRISLAVRPSGERVVSRKTAATMTRLMENVVEGGTGTAARIGGVRVAGKTGTAEVDVNGKRMNHAWFVTFAPADDPKVAVAVVSELGGIGGQVAAPLARAILEATLPLVRS